jgi:uncharacterized membrane protein YuzA (DUF378 family)
MRTLDVLSWILLFIGGLNWLLIGLFGFNFVTVIFGQLSLAARIIYAIVGIATVYAIAELGAMPRRWAHRVPCVPTPEMPQTQPVVR